MYQHLAPHVLIQLLFLVAGLFIPHILFADNSISTRSNAANSPLVMPEVLVEDDRISPTTGTVILDRETVEALPKRNGSVNELIGSVPGVQFNEKAMESTSQGEIFPPQVSISGSRYYDNNYTIDGISNNSPLDPAIESISSSNRLPGFPQIHLISPQIIDQITVYNSNIPAEFGGFTGGQVDTTTIEAEDQFHGKINYRTTRSAWTSFHIDKQNEEEFKNSDSSTNQPKFEKHEVGITLSGPITEDTGIVTSYQQLYSRIPLQHFGEEKNQSRTRENIFVKLTHYLADSSKLTVTAIASPTKSRYFLRNIKDSVYDIETDNKTLGIQYERDFDLGEARFQLGYTDQKTRRDAPKDRLFWSTATPSIDWEAGREGGLGDLEVSQKEFSAKADFTFNSFNTGKFNHRIKLGAELSNSDQEYKRPHTSYYYYSAVLDPALVCTPGDVACIPNEQYLSRRVVYNKTNAEADVLDAALFLQDVISWKRLELFPGLRFSYDSFTEEKNVAPRLSSSLDLFGNRRTILFAGVNRYYSGTILTHALYRNIKSYNQQRTTPGNSDSDWTGTTNSLFDTSKVKTPYTDEKTIGVIQRVLDGELKVQYIEKTSKNEFAKTRVNNPYPEPDVYLLNNNGRSEHESLQASWQRAWKNHFVELNATWQKTTSSNSSYDKTLELDDLQETIWYDGEELYKHEIPRLDFNRPVVANLIYRCRLPYDISFTNVTRYRGAYWRLWNTKEKKPSVIEPDQPSDPYVYEKRKNKPVFTFDWHISWKLPSRVKQNVVLNLDILNLFNKRSKVAYQSGTSGYDYEIGRQVWAGMEFNF